MGAAVRKVEPVQSSQVSSRRISRVVLMIAVSVAAIATAIAFNLLVDPYGVWGTGVLRPIFRKVDYKHLRIAVPGIIRIDRPETLLLGSSRMVFGVPIEQVSRDGVTNGALTE